MTTYRIPDYQRARPAPFVVSSVRVETNGHHDTVTVWNRGGLAGTLTVKVGDGETLRRAIMPDCIVEEVERG